MLYDRLTVFLVWSPLISHNTNPEIDITPSGANVDAIGSTAAPVRHQGAQL